MNDTEPYVVKEYKNIYFAFKPPYWNCVTGQDYIKLKQKNVKNLFLDFVKSLTQNSNVNDVKYDFGMSNRLDYETSGIVIIAKNIDSYKKYRKQINDHKNTTKIYVALVNGEIKTTYGIISIGLSKNEKIHKTYPDENGKFSFTEYVKINTYIKDDEIYTLLLIKIKTGRTHQIRVHLKYLNHNVVCDKTYNPNNKSCKISSRLFLHALYYKIENDIDCYVKIPKDLDDALNSLTLLHKYINKNNAFDILKTNCLTDEVVSDLQEK
jgi:23S rRNA-/tRNA-specific pseudouridylate synthase